MKNIIIIGLASLVLFSVSAALSLWLQGSKATPTTGEEKAAKKKGGDADHGSDREHKDDDKAKADAKGADKPAEPKLNPGPKDADTRAEFRRLQMEVVVQDMREYGDNFVKLSKQVSAESKAAIAEAEVANQAKASELTKIEQANAKVTADLKKDRVEMEAAEKKNLERIATLSDQMPPEKAAEVIQQLADNGNMDTAVKVLANMKERTAARVMAELKDPSLPPQLIERMRLMKRPAAGGSGGQ